MIDRIKTVGIIVLLIFALASASATVFLVKTNTRLHSEISTLELKLDISTAQVKTMQDQSRVNNETMQRQVEDGLKAEDTFAQLNNQLAELKCPDTSSSELKAIQYAKQTNTSTKASSSDANDIASVGRLLDKAACTANSDCKPSESPVK